MDCKEIRHQLHRMAEASNEEVKTSAFIRHELERLAPTKILTFPKGNHLLAEFDFGGGGKTVLLRADMDAVRVNETLGLPYLKNAKSMPVEEQKKREGELILKKIESDEFVVLWDERGKELTSKQFADFIQQRANTGLKTLTFVIGGAYGFSDAVYARQNAQLALSKLTFPHIMVRLIFAEQLYRACTILKGEPYHH